MWCGGLSIDRGSRILWSLISIFEILLLPRIFLVRFRGIVQRFSILFLFQSCKLVPFLVMILIFAMDLFIISFYAWIYLFNLWQFMSYPFCGNNFIFHVFILLIMGASEIDFLISCILFLILYIFCLHSDIFFYLNISNSRLHNFICRFIFDIFLDETPIMKEDCNSKVIFFFILLVHYCLRHKYNMFVNHIFFNFLLAVRMYVFFIKFICFIVFSN
jgi:hypothetical protein